jgi:Ni,Fe-hydrogenase III large subunit/Ni,Fe-hydrogenase III component G
MAINSNLKKYSAGGLDVKEEGNVISFRVPAEQIKETCRRLYFDDKLRLLTITASRERKDGDGSRIIYLFGVPGENIFVMPYVNIAPKEGFVSITKEIHAASGFERKIRTFFGLEPVGHPNPRQILLHENWPENIHPLRKDFDWQKRPADAKGAYDFQKVEGEGIYEIPVGPVHAGIIEPGHFRFSVAGEEIVLLEPKLGYKHKGIEKLFEILPLADKVRLSERVSGDTSFTHSLAFCQALESIAEVKVPQRAEYLRVIYSELERLANHLNDIGFILLDTGYSFGGANGARLRETVMQWNERLSGSRFLRGVNAVGGVNTDIPNALHEPLLKYLDGLLRDFNEVVGICENSISVFNRLEGTGKLDKDCAIDHGVVGIAARALGLSRDARKDFSYAAYDRIKFEPALENDGDVRARFAVRVAEIRSSIKIIEQAIKEMPKDGEIKNAKPFNLRKNAIGVGIAEGWRGEIVYLVLTDDKGEVSRVDVRDPSFVNWTVLGYAGKGNVVPDFPLINKSFNLSYSGNDL